jgi:hypothetical protein
VFTNTSLPVALLTSSSVLDRSKHIILANEIAHGPDPTTAMRQLPPRAPKRRHRDGYKAAWGVSVTPAEGSKERSAPSQQEVEDQILARLAEVGLSVPARDPSRPHTKTEEGCGERGAVSVPVDGGKSSFYRPRCRSKGCVKDCSQVRADVSMTKIRACQSEFVGIEDVCRGSLVYGMNADKIPHDALWVTLVPTPPEEAKAVKERVQTRVRRLVKGGLKVEAVLIPCDGATIIVSTRDLAEQKARGRKSVAPRSGWWCPPGVALLFLNRTLASTAVNGRIWWTAGWKAQKPPKKAYVVFGSPTIAKTAHRIMTSEDYEFTESVWDFDPLSELWDAKDRAEIFWKDPRCSTCKCQLSSQNDHWWRAGKALCGTCDLACDLVPILTRGLTEREIESQLRHRKLTFKRKRALIEEALARAGATKLRTGIWMPKIAEEDVG